MNHLRRGTAADAVVLVTPRSFRDADPAVRERLERSVREVRYNDIGGVLSRAELQARLGDVDGVIAGLDPLDAETIAAAPRLRAIARYGTGVDTVDLRAAARAGITVTHTPQANAVAVAELTIALILALLRRLTELDSRVRAGEWRPLCGGELRGRTLGIVGLGRIGTAVAARARAFECTVLATDPAADAGASRELGVQLVGLHELVSRSAILTLHVPVTEGLRGFVGAELLGALPDGALLVNTARPELVDEAALIEALNSGRLGGAAIDLAGTEPPPDHPLRARPNVIITPHVGAHTKEAIGTMARDSIAELLAVLDGDEPRFPVAGPATGRPASATDPALGDHA